MIRWNSISVYVLSAVIAAAAAIVYFSGAASDKPHIELSGKELRDGDISVATFSRYMKIVRWDWRNGRDQVSSASEQDSATYLDTIYLSNPHRSPILWHDVTVVRGQVFIEYMSSPWRLVDQAEYEEKTTNSKLEYEVLIKAPKDNAAPTWFIRQFRYVNTFQPEDGRSQAGLRIPYRTELVQLLLDFGALPVAQRPLKVSCRVRRPENSESNLVDAVCPGTGGTADMPVFAFTLTEMPAGSQVVLEWSPPDRPSLSNETSK